MNLKKNKTIKFTKKLTSVFFICLVLVQLSFSFAEGLTNSEISKIKQQIIQESIGKYRGSCPCPYNRMKNGRSCGRNSAYSKPGGKSPLCYESDVSITMVNNFKK
jgi:hypothetical protein